MYFRQNVGGESCVCMYDQDLFYIYYESAPSPIIIGSVMDNVTVALVIVLGIMYQSIFDQR